MAEEVKQPKPKKKNFEYKLLSHSDKIQMLLEMLYELEQTLFNHNINKLDEKHSEYPEWEATNKEIQKEIMRMRFLYEKIGGSWDIQDEDEYDERGELLE
jgi:hypothetical protein